MGCTSSKQKKDAIAPEAKGIPGDSTPSTQPGSAQATPMSTPHATPSKYQESWGPSLEPAPAPEPAPAEKPLERAVQTGLPSVEEARPDEQSLEEAALLEAGEADLVEKEASARELIAARQPELADESKVPLVAAHEQQLKPQQKQQPPYWQVYLKKWRGAGVQGPAVPPWSHSGMSFVGSFTGIGTLGLIQTYLFPHLTFAPLVLLIGSFGAMAVLVFGQPVAPPSQPWNAVCGNTLGALVGVTVYLLLGLLGLEEQLWLVGALAVSLAIVAQELTQSQHPPGGATALLFALMPNLQALGFAYVLCPACLGAAVFVILAMVINNASPSPSRSFPQSVYPLPNPAEPKKLLAELKKDIAQAFQKFDEDGSGEIDSTELQHRMKLLGFSKTKEEVADMIKSVDDDDSGTLEYEEFVHLMMRMILKPSNKQDILQATSTPEMDISNMQKLAKELRDSLTEKEIEEGKLQEGHESAWRQYVIKFKGQGAPPMMRPPLTQTFFSWLGSFTGIAVLGMLHMWVLSALPAPDVVLLVGSFGAMSVLLYSIPAAPFSQPKNALLGNTLGGVIGVAVVKLFELATVGYLPWLMSALAVSLTIVAQERTASVHPPGGATALIFVIRSCAAGLPQGHPFAVTDVLDWYVFCPAFLGTAILVFVALVVNNVSEKRSYPARWW